MSLLIKKLSVILLIILINTSCQTQKVPNIKSLNGDKSPTAKLESLDWIVGNWQGKALGGITEEQWSSPSAGSMMGMFKLISDGEVSFYELMVISEVEESLILRIKHFDRQMRGWEEKDKSVEFPLVDIKENRVYFDGLTFEKINEDQINVYVLLEEEGSEPVEVSFPYFRKK